MARRTRERHRPAPPPDNHGGSEPDASGASDTYRVGYKKPPLDTRFQPGQSGNPRGRPKGALSGGKPRAKLKRLLDKALQGDARASARIINLVAGLLDQAEADATPPVDHGAAQRKQEATGERTRTRTRTRTRIRSR